MFDPDLIRRQAEALPRRRAVPGRDETAGPAGTLLALQRDAGNRAVSTLVQRAPRDRPASTDAPGAKRKGKRGKEPSKPDVTTRIVHIEVRDKQLVITFQAGSDAGVEPGMTAGLFASEKPAPEEKPLYTVEITAVPGRSEAATGLRQDDLSNVKGVVIWVSRGSGRPQTKDQQI